MTVDIALPDVRLDRYDQVLAEAWQRLTDNDPRLARLLVSEFTYQRDTLGLIAASSPARPDTVLAEGTPFAGVTAEGYPGRRFHSGTRHVDQLEELTIERATSLFKARHANVQPHSGSSANLAMIFSVLEPGDTILSMDLDAGGHLTHGASASITSRYFNIVTYGVDPGGMLDFDQIHTIARVVRPKLIICGASSYPRTIDFGRFRAIADDVGACLLADISHISGLVVAGEHPSPIDHAHITTTSTYKQLRGPRGGLILLGTRASERIRGRTIRALVDRAVFPGFQGTPNFAGIAAKAVALEHASRPGFTRWAVRIRRLAGALGTELAGRGFPLVTGGTDTHMVVVDLRRHGPLTGKLAEDLLSDCGVLVNRNRIPSDPRPASVTSGLRLGSNEIAARRVPEAMVGELVECIASVLTSGAHAQRTLTEYVRWLCRSCPIEGWPR